MVGRETEPVRIKMRADEAVVFTALEIAQALHAAIRDRRRRARKSDQDTACRLVHASYGISNDPCVRISPARTATSNERSMPARSIFLMYCGDRNALTHFRRHADLRHEIPSMPAWLLAISCAVKRLTTMSMLPTA